MTITIYHNPRCSKSRKTLELLEARNIRLEVVEYLKTPPNAAALEQLLKDLDMTPRDLMRKGEAVFKELKLGDSKFSNGELIDTMIANPILIERPIVTGNGKAVIGRPPENIEKLFAS